MTHIFELKPEKLIGGKIPPKTVCPFKDKCDFAKYGSCYHKGIESEVYFSCALARLFNITERNNV